MKHLLVLLSFCFSISAFALEQQELVQLSCTGANGLTLDLTSESNQVFTELRGFKKTYQSDRVVRIHNFTGQDVARIILSRLNAPNVFEYDIYLERKPTKGEFETLKGVIGHSVYTVVFPPFLAPVPMPVGFVPSTAVSCFILTK